MLQLITRQKAFGRFRFAANRHFVITVILAISLGIASGCKQRDAEKKVDQDKESTPASSTEKQTDKSKWAKAVELDGCPNLHKVSDGLYRGAQPEEEGFAELEGLGIKTVVCLRRWHDDEDEIEGTKLGYVAIPMNTWEPSKENVLKFLKVATDAEKQPVFVHCQHGADRTGTMIAIYRIVVEDWSKEEAMEEMREGDFGYHEVWKMLPEFIRELDVEELKKELEANI